MSNFGVDPSIPPHPTMGRIWLLREASNVRRCHNTPHHGVYTDGKHTYDMLTLLLELFPDSSFSLVKAVIYHDVGERLVGDLPQSVKWWSPDIATHHRAAEDAVLEALGYKKFIDRLTGEEKKHLLLCDRLELMLWCLEQMAFGNMHIINIARVLEGWFVAQKDTLPRIVLEILRDIEQYGWSRQPETLAGMPEMKPETHK